VLWVGHKAPLITFRVLQYSSTAICAMLRVLEYGRVTPKLFEMRGRPAARFLGDMTTPRRPGESLLQCLVGIFSQNFTLWVSIVRLLKYEHLHIKYRSVTIIVLIGGPRPGYIIESLFSNTVVL
jgi:hypothetical protein